MVRRKSKSSKKKVVNESVGRDDDVRKDPTVATPEEKKEEGADAIGTGSIEKKDTKSEGSPNNDNQPESAEPGKLASNEESEVDEVWDILRVIPMAEEKIECRYEHCCEQAVAIWATDKDPQEKWPLCEKCQLQDFGGWPEGVEPIERSKDNSDIAEKNEIPPANNEKKNVASATSSSTPASTEPSKDDSETPLLTNKDQTVASQEDNNADATEEKYELVRIVPFEKLISSPIKCSDESCNLPACSVWTSAGDPKKWYYCIDCQEKDFGGWPPFNELPCEYLSPEHLRAIAKNCSKKRKPTMPKFASKCVTPNPSRTPKGPASSPAVVSAEMKRSVSKVSRAAVARHEKWQADAKKMGVDRIIVKKSEAKRVIFDAVHDAFRPMNVDGIYMLLKKMVPLPVLKATLAEMTDLQDDELFGPNDDDDDGNEANKKKKASEIYELFSGSIFFKAGRSAASSLYYAAYNRINELTYDEKRELLENSSNSKAKYEQLILILKELEAKTNQLLGEPKNDELIGRLGDLENDVSILQKKVNDAKALTVNESHKNKLKRRIQSMVGHYRKRKQLCCSFLSSLEEISDGAISKKKCLKGDGQIALDSDKSAINAAKAYAKSKRFSKVKKTLLADENFVGVVLDSQQMIKRVYVDNDVE